MQMSLVDRERLDGAFEMARRALLAELGPEGHWTGELAASALSTATAVSALSLLGRTEGKGAQSESSVRTAFDPLVERGLKWLAEYQNPDGGWGDTPKSLSNVATTMLAQAAFHLADVVEAYVQTVARADRYIIMVGGVDALRARYGSDRTFAVPILTTCALAGQVDWREVNPLPFELACLPQRWYRWLRLPVVSYALPALIGVGQARFAAAPPRNPAAYLVRRAAVRRSLRVLERIQPTSGGFLEAVPLTSFVVMGLAGSGRAEHPVVRKATRFLLDSVRDDGSWAIDSNLSVWTTTLSVNALTADVPAATGCDYGEESFEGDPQPRSAAQLDAEQSDSEDIRRLVAIRDWLLEQQFHAVHPYTGAEPGGWGWTHLPGSVPDADDTAGALLALSRLPKSRRSYEAAVAGLRWLLNLQNRDGGWPTFCRGWGHLPFDRSGADLTAHALRALEAWARLFERLDAESEFVAVLRAIPAARQRGLCYLSRVQREDGSWVPLWFGNQYAPAEENPTYGTARVLAAYGDLDLLETDEAIRGFAWLRRAQHYDGGWGGAVGVTSSIEETALATEALLADREGPNSQRAVRNGLDWLIRRVEAEELQDAAPIGFYFAKLWYYEKLYPTIFAAGALRRASETWQSAAEPRARSELTTHR